MVRPLVAALADADESRRHDAVRATLDRCGPRDIRVLADRLLELGGGTARRQALASLAQLGPAVVPALTYRLTHARSAASQLEMVEVLARVAPRLGTAGRVDLMMELGIILARFAADETVRRGLQRLVAVLRTADATPARAGHPAGAATPAAPPKGGGWGPHRPGPGTRGAVFENWTWLAPATATGPVRRPAAAVPCPSNACPEE
jgi:hypothetical protein